MHYEKDSPCGPHYITNYFKSTVLLFKLILYFYYS